MLQQPPLRTAEPIITDGYGDRFRVSDQSETERIPNAFWGTLSLSALLGCLLLGALVYLANPWAIIGNTRILNLLIAGGIIKYHDRHAGIVEGVAAHVYYLKAHDPVAWPILAIVIGLYLIIAAIKAMQFHDIARAFGIVGTLHSHARSYFYGLLYSELLPFRTGNAAVAAAMQTTGTSLEQTRSALFALKLFFIFEVAVFALVGLLNIGWAAWFFQLFCALLILATFYFWSRADKDDRRRREDYPVLQAIYGHMAVLGQQPTRLILLALASLISFALRDLAAYMTAMAFSSQNVLLNIPPSLMLMGVLGGYIASSIRLTPGGIGQFEWGFATALFIGGIGLPEAATVALLVNFFRYVALFVLYLLTIRWSNIQTSFRTVMELMYSKVWQGPIVGIAVTEDMPALHLPAQREPSPQTLWARGLVVVWIIFAVWLLDQATILFSDLWFLQSLELGSVFATNFRMSLLLFISAFVSFGIAVALPLLSQPSIRKQWKLVIGGAALIGTIAGSLFATEYHTLLPLVTHISVGETDPVFGRDLSFYLFVLPGLWLIRSAFAWLALVALVSSIGGAIFAASTKSNATGRRRHWISIVATPAVCASWVFAGLVVAMGVWLSRFELLFKENDEASVFNGAAHVDVSGFLSTLTQLNATIVVVLGITLLVALALWHIYATRLQPTATLWSQPIRRIVAISLLLITLDFVLSAGVALRQMLAVTPNQPVIQLEYIGRHIDATRKAYGLDRVEEIEFASNDASDPLPSLERVLSSPTIKNEPLWPTSVWYLERLVDPQHAQRILQTGGETMVYGPTLENFRQEQKLRTYYDFLSLAPLRFQIDGETKVFAAAVRELPILEPQPWLAWWGQRFMLFTHGHGLVMAPIAEVADGGDPVFASSNIPVDTRYPELAVSNQHIYYGQGNANMAVSNVRDVAEFDFPTDQGRAVNTFSSDSQVGVTIDSPLKRLVFGWRSGELTQFAFSWLITPETRVHFYRQPMERLDRIAPFLFYDNAPYPAPIDGEVVWLVNGVTTSDHYPYSKREFLGDKSVSRSPDVIENRRINYVEDSVKATISAATGEVRFYKIANAPVIDTWARIYPGLFIDTVANPDAMPAAVRQQLTYPVHLFHIQFDDLYIYYHMNDPMYFFNMEDMWDDADEVLGPLMDQGRAITFSIEPNQVLLETGTLLPASSSGSQFAMTMTFTPEGARNLRAMPIAYQDGEDYGRLFVLQVPKGHYVMGPEQADAIIDQDPDISQQISWWNRRGTEVIRGHTSTLVVDDELIYVEPIFIRSQQNSITQLKRVVVVLRDKAYMAETLEGALRLALDKSSPGIAQSLQ